MASTIAQRRLLHQRLTASTFQNPHTTVQWLGGVQAQDYASALWTIGVRLPGATVTQIEEAIATRALVRTWLFRGTLHIVAGDDLRWMLALLAPTLLARFAPYYRQLSLDDATVTQSYTVMRELLQGGAQLTRQQLLTDLAQRGLHLEGQRASNLLNRAALDAQICLGPMQGKQQSFVLLDAWLPQGKVYTRDEALAELALRYFTSHGPTTVQDFAWWAGLLMADARIGLEAVKDQLVEETLSSKSYWSVPTMPTVPTDAPQVHLLPGFDEFVLGYGDRRDFLQREHEALISGVNAVFAYTMLLDGQVMGTWKRVIRKGAVEITLTPFTTLAPTTLERFAHAAQRYGDFLGLPVTIKTPNSE